MRITTYVTALAAVQLCSASQSDYGYWDVAVYRSWAASGYRSWGLEANYSLTPGSVKHSTWNYSPVNGSTETLHHDVNFVSTLSGSDDSEYPFKIELLEMRPCGRWPLV